MRTSNKALIGGLGLALAAAAAYPAIGQQRPESILPPGFGEPAPAPRATAAAPRAPGSAGPAPRPSGAAPIAGASPVSATVQPLPVETPGATPTPTPTPTPPDARVLAEYELPASARRSLALVGAAGPAEGGLAADAFGEADGRMVEMLMRRLSAPLPSRWMSILLRRALVSSVATPPYVNGADFAAERAWLLLRMGESVAARAVVQGVDDANYTPKLLQVAMNAELANGDPAGLCPLADAGVRIGHEGGWTLAQAMCAGLAGQSARGTALFAAARRHHVAGGVDLLLAQKVLGIGGQGRQAVTIEWDGVDRLTAWRFGLATATGVAIPDSLYAGAGRQVTYWRALSPGVPLNDRIAAAEAAAAQGVLSSAALIDLYGAVDAANDSPSAADATAQDLQTAYASASPDARAAALRQLWGNADARIPYARMVLTARAAGLVMPAANDADAATLIAAMLSAGLDRTALRWQGYVPQGSDAWAMLALADPKGRTVSYRDLNGYAGKGDAVLKRRMFFAGMAGLGRVAPADVERAAESLDVKIGAENAWTAALDRAARAGQPGTVALLAAIGMQTGDWRGVPPQALYRIVGALRAVGLEGEARMIAAEAIARV